MPKIVRVHEIGGPEKLKVDDLPSRQPGPQEVKLRVQAVGLNRAESLYMRGSYVEQPRVPSRIGYEAAGIVEAVGEGVDASWIGKKVATVPGFSQNQYGVLGEEAIVPVSTLGEYPGSFHPSKGQLSGCSTLPHTALWSITARSRLAISWSLPLPQAA